MSKRKLRVNIVSESEISVQGHGVHTAYEEMVRALGARQDVEVITGQFNKKVDCDIVHIHTVGPLSLRKLLQRGPKKVVSAHVVPDSFVGSLIFAKYWRFAAVWYLRWFYNRADVVLAVSDEAKRDLVELGVRRPIELFYNFIDKTRYQTSRRSRADVRQSLGIAGDSFVVIGAGQVQPRKRIDWFIAAAQQLTDVEFVWVGGMPFGAVASDGQNMRNMIDQAPANVHFPGVVPLDDMVTYYHAADAFCLPSEQETFGLVVVEAAASGLPIVLRDIVDYADTFGRDAVLVTDDTFVDAIELLRDNPAHYQEKKQQASQIANRFDSVPAADKLIKLYRQMV